MAVDGVPKRQQTRFELLYRHVQDERNSALHEGACARHLTRRCIELALFIEDALTTSMDRIGDFMVRGPMCASPWQYLSFVRQTMLANSFSFLPVRIAREEGEQWYLVSDYGLARYLRSVATTNERVSLLRQSLGSAAASQQLVLHKPLVCTPDYPLTQALDESRGLPILIRGDREEDLIGIASPYDLL